MDTNLLKIGDRVRLTNRRGLDLATVLRVLSFPSGEGFKVIYVLELDEVDPMTGSKTTTVFREEIERLENPMEAERLRRRMAFDVAAGKGKR